MKQFTFFKTLLIAAVMLLGSGSVIGQKTYEMITSNTGLVDGGKYLIMGQKEADWYALGLQNSNNRASVLVTVTGNKTTVTIATAASDTKPFEITLGASGSNWTLYDAVNAGYLYAAGGTKNNYLKTQTQSTDFSISIAADGKATVRDETTGVTRNLIRLNPNNPNPPLFSCYESGQNDIYLFKEVESDCESPNLRFAEEEVTVSIADELYEQEAESDNEWTEITYSSSNLNIATVDEDGYVELLGIGTVTITASQAAGSHNGVDYCAATATYTLTITPIPAPQATAATNVGSTGFTANWNAVSGATGYLLSVHSGSVSLNEDFSSITGTGGNDGGWSGNVAVGPLDSFGDWGLANVYKGNNCLKAGTGSKQGSITTPELGLNGNATLTFRAGAWDGNGEHINLLLEITGGGSLGVNSVTMTKGAFTNYSVNITGGTATTKITFKGEIASNSRFFLDDVKVSNSTPISGSPFTVTGTSKNITGLNASTTYYYTVKAVAGGFESEESNEISVETLEAGAVTTFTGTGTWTEVARWDNDIPNENIDAVILGDLMIDVEDAECRNLIIEPSGKVTIDGSEGLLIVNGDLLIKSNASGTGSFIPEDGDNCIEVLGNATIQRYISAANWNNAESGWHLISSPVSGQWIEDSWTPMGSGNDYDFYALDESKENEYWLNQKVGENDILFFEPGKGYLVAYQQSDTKEFNGAEILNGVHELTINTSDVTISGLTNTTGSAYPGWHLLGNPFSSALEYDNTWTKSSIDALIQVWNSQEGSYQTSFEVGGIIPAMNGFMVHTSGNGSITIPASKRVHNSTNWYKSGEDFILLVARDLDGTTSQSSIVRFNPAATTGYDSQFDSYFLAGFAPMFYSVSGDDLYALNTLPEQSSGLVVPFGFVKNNSSNFSIELEKSLPGSVLYLTDNKTGETVNLTEGGSYQFTSEEGDDANRFALHFAPLGIEKPGAALDAKIYAYQQVVYLAGLDTRTEVTITDLMGRTVKRVQLNGGDLSTINAAGLPKGAYIVTAVSASGSVSAKVIL